MGVSRRARKRKPIEADVKVGQSYRGGDDSIGTFQSLNPLHYTYNGHEQGGGVLPGKWSFV